MMTENITIIINSIPQTVPKETSVLVALEKFNSFISRESLSGEKRAPLCGMGICFECRVTINNKLHQRACKRICEEGMTIVCA